MNRVQLQGYLFVLITMCIWGGFTILSRLSAKWGIVAWDLTALRFAFAFMILLPILLYQRNYQFLFQKQAIVLALFGGIGYCLTVYSGFYFAPAAHAAIFLNGFIPVCTAVAAYIMYKQPFDRNIWISVIIMSLSLMLMTYLLSLNSHQPFGLGDLLFVLGAVCWGIFTVLLRESSLTAWQAMSSVAIWSAIMYLPVYVLFMPKHLAQVEPEHLLIQTLFHGILVVIVATLSYVEAIKRLGAFQAGSIVTLAPFIAAVLAIPLLNEPVSPAIICGLIGIGFGALQPWRWLAYRRHKPVI
ncbi:EamA domain-containing membrane protein RarD [Acinetobacter marinus]|uniref:EamA domain-containing membrane protein RarD n=1 Tax=Acinetobacter marinus TaxID=281375 RepID=A0A1G6HGI5_9GAMM|nr:DMT family transporter [Acinetobacter marinus]SDB93350.1 EamA domain-containing membrane protein RarD [Acinetobacter marinus]